jgi:hypothetical protein
MTEPRTSTPGAGAPAATDAEALSIVGVAPGATLAAHRRLFDALEAAYPVRFCAWDSGEQVCDALIVTAAGAVPSRPEGAPDVPVLAIAADAPAATGHEDVRLAGHEAIDRRLRGLTLPVHEVRLEMRAAEGDEVIADGSSGAFWTLTPGPLPVHRVRAALPALGADDVVRTALVPERALALVALVHFVRSLVGERWQEPALRACVLFDDPNLRWPSYGYIDYRRLVAHADAHGYHASMAMIPLDARWPHARAVATFRSRPDRLSLVIHGNDHNKRELMQPANLSESLGLVAQALRRVTRFEARTGLRVDRVMVPPYGLCSRPVAQALGAVGYDALCAIHPFPWTERPPGDHLLAGWAPTTFLDGCAIVPRFPLPSSAAEIALRAFLGQPLVLYGHHDDLSDGLDPLVTAAADVNRLGEVQWMSLGGIVESSYDLRVASTTAVIRPWARRMRVALPPGVTDLVVQAPAMTGDVAGLRGWRTPGQPAVDFGARRLLSGDREVVVELVPQWETDPLAVRSPAWRPWPAMRRMATEARDRLLALRAATL